MTGETRMLGHYQIGAALGKGATGVVYEGTDARTGQIVAIKTLALSEECDADGLAEAKVRFFHEAGTAQRLAHPDIVTVYSAGEDRDIAYIAMERLHGADLTRYVGGRERLPLAQLLPVIARVAEALAYAHRRGVVHGDIKPANIVWEAATGTVKITDFGMAHAGDVLSTGSGMALGTPSYMSPEQLSGDRIDGRSDLFSLGISLYQLLCGRLPFEGESLGQLRFRIMSEAHPDIRVHDPGLPACLGAIVDTALAKEPARRYQDGTQMADALRVCLADASASDGQTPGRVATSN
jgi:serine/threonine-protein kinase